MSRKRARKAAPDASRLARRSRVALLVFAAALAVRLVYLAEASADPSFDVLIVDSQSYDQHARLLVSEGTFYSRFFWQGFFYPFFLAGTYLVSGGSILFARLVQIVLGSCMCALVCALGEKLFDRRIGCAAGMIAALYGPLVYYDAEILDAGFSAIWAVALLLLCLRAREAKSALPALLFGVAGGLAVATRATFAPFFLAAAVWLVLAPRETGAAPRRAAARAGFLAAGFLAAALPVASLAHRATGEFSFLPQSGPLNLFIGNNPDRNATIMIRPGSEWRELTRMPTVQGSPSDAEDRRVFMRRFIDYVKSEPGGYAAGLAAKAVEFASSRELPRNESMYVARDRSRLLSILVWKAGPFGFPFGLLLPLAVAGIALFPRRFPAPVYLFLALYPAAVVAVFVSGRYRAPVVPVLAVPAAAGLLRLVDLARARLWPRAAALAASVAAVAVASSVAGPFAAERHDYRAEMHTIVGFELMKRNRTREAYEELSEALRVHPGWGDAHKYIGLLMSGERRHEEAAAHFGKALEQDPDSYFLRYYLGTTLLNLGKRAEGFAELRTAREGAVEAKEDELIRQIDRILGPGSPGDPRPGDVDASGGTAR